MAEAIPLLDLTPEVDALWGELRHAFEEVVRDGRFIMGPAVRAFESEIADYLGVRHTVGLNSGTDALVIAMRALGIGAGDEVITSPFTFFATPEAISHVGATPVFADIDPLTYNLDPAAVAERMTGRTRALLPVHLYGQAADMAGLTELAVQHDLVIVEDVAQALSGLHDGRQLGTIGRVGAFSFFPSKNLGAYGDGGLIATEDDDLAETARMLRAHGARKKYHNEALGYNSRLDTLQAAILRVKLPHLDEYSAGRRRVAEYYTQRLAGVAGLEVPVEAAYATCVYHQYTVRILDGRRDAVQAYLADRKIQTMIYYPVPCHKLPVYAGLHQPALPQAERAAAEVLSLPIWPQMMPDRQDVVIAALEEALRSA